MSICFFKKKGEWISVSEIQTLLKPFLHKGFRRHIPDLKFFSKSFFN
jgi:hypothetical protein